VTRNKHLASCSLFHCNVIDSDDVITRDEQIYLLIGAHARCERSIKAQMPLIKDGDCTPEWDGIICWPQSTAGQLVSVQCPEYIYDFNHRGRAYRQCDVSGNWEQVASINRTWANYSECTRYLTFNHRSHEEKVFERLHLMYTIGYSISPRIPSVASKDVFLSFRRLHCNTQLHPTFTSSPPSSVERSASLVKDAVLYSISDGSEAEPNLQDRSWLKAVCTLFLYFWQQIITGSGGGVVLHSLIFMAFLSDKNTCVPAVFVSIWVRARASLADISECWDLSAGNLKWIIKSYSGWNFLLFINIIRVLASKLWETNTGKLDPDSSTGNPPRKILLKSTLVLMPLFGVHYMVFMALPYTEVTGLLWQVQMHYEMFFNSSQGFFVAFIYCFCNGEVQTEVKKAWLRRSLVLDLKQKTRITSSGGGSCYYGGMMSHTTTHSVCLSAAIPELCPLLEGWLAQVEPLVLGQTPTATSTGCVEPEGAESGGFTREAKANKGDDDRKSHREEDLISSLSPKELETIL
uniref:Parathyroid hormone/parathyroid hormone-related peptide receptor n=1 Tax=Maylandia zebra TaxID=106582 RepID=A0A3P9CCU8_9CICH